MDLIGKNVIYLGGFGGIGQKCIREFLSKGIQNLAIFDLNENAVVMKELQTAFPATHIFYIKLDITKKDNIEAAYKEAVGIMGHFDVVVNGCGLMDDRFIELTIQINLIGVIHSTLSAMNYMSKENGGQGGVIVNISSVAGLEPTAMLAVYSASKNGVTAFTRSLAHPFYYNQTGVALVTICPGFTETGLLENPCTKATFPKYGEKLAERFVLVRRQTPEVCAKNLVKAVEIAKNGSAWILDLGEMKEVQFATYWEPPVQT